MKKHESFGDLVDRVFKKVQAHMKWDEAKTSLWFRTENPNFGGCTPDDFLMRRPDKIERVIDALIEGEGP